VRRRGALPVSSEPLIATGASLEVAFDFVLHEIPVSLSLEVTIRSANGGDTQSVAGAS